MTVKTGILISIATAQVTGIDIPVASADETLPPELIACTNERDVIRRLSCFDRVMAQLLAEPGAVRQAVATAPPEPAPEPAPLPQAAAASEVAPASASEPTSEPAPAIEPAPDPGPAPQSEMAAPPTVATRVAVAPVAEEVQAAKMPAESPPAEPVGVPAAKPPPVASAASVQRENSVYVPDEFRATVTNIRKRPYGELIILLSNGQIWEQKHLDRRFRLEVGDEVTISRGKVSGYRLRGRGNNSIQVERLQ